VRALATISHRLGRQVTVAALLPTQEQHPWVNLLRQDGVRVVDVRCRRRHYLEQSSAIAGIARDVGATVLHTHIRDADLVGFLAARECRLPVVATVHGLTGSGWRNDLFIWLDLQILRRFDAVICVSRGVRERVLRSGLRPERLHLIPNGRATSRVLPRQLARAKLGFADSETVIGWVGRLSVEKGPDLFLDAIERLNTSAVAVLLGEGPERESLATRAVSREGRCKVRLLGRQDEAASLMSAFDVVVISSRSEGTPMVLLEAMAARVPVISFAVGGVPDVVDEATAWLVPREDTAALARAIRDALADPAQRQRRAEAASKILERGFGERQWFDRVSAVYQMVQRQARRTKLAGGSNPHHSEAAGTLTE
jgi:glycosyltransferase involved in cell wall biosynthesis